MTIQRIINAYMETEVKLHAFQPWRVFIVVWTPHVYHKNANKRSINTLYILRCQKTGQSCDIWEHIWCWRNVFCCYCYTSVKIQWGWMPLKNSPCNFINLLKIIQKKRHVSYAPCLHAFSHKSHCRRNSTQKTRRHTIWSLVDSPKTTWCAVWWA